MPNSESTSETALQYRAIKSTAGMRVLDDHLIVRISGDDGVSFMHGMSTANVKGLEPGRVAPALFVTEHAHVIADCFVYAVNDALLLEIAGSRWPGVRTHLEKLLVADDV
jgi:aminomethyltransferase